MYTLARQRCEAVPLYDSRGTDQGASGQLRDFMRCEALAWGAALSRPPGEVPADGSRPGPGAAATRHLHCSHLTL